MEIAEAKSAVKALYLLSASLAGLEVSSLSPEVLADIVQQGFSKVDAPRRPEAVANVLKLLAATIQSAQSSTTLHEGNVQAGQTAVCPVYPFG